jgi:hypothetical protein
MIEHPSRERRAARAEARARRRETFVRIVMVCLLLVTAFVLGIAVSRTLDERPKDGDVVTDVRTLTPLPQQPPARTVTVTVTTP